MRTRAVIRQFPSSGRPCVELYHEVVLADTEQLFASIDSHYKTVYGKVVDIRITSASGVWEVTGKADLWRITIAERNPEGSTLWNIIYAETIRNDDL